MFFSAFKLTKNADINKYKYSAYSIGFDGKGTFSLPSGQFSQNVIIFDVDLSSSIHVYNKKKYILILGEDPTQRLDGATLTAQKKCSINFTVRRKKIV